jgi:hypothetical protein
LGFSAACTVIFIESLRTSARITLTWSALILFLIAATAFTALSP